MVKTVCLKNFDFSSQTDRGKVRDRNEDYLAYFDTQNGHVFVVCDGMGGHNAGDVASELAVESVGRYFNQKYYPNPFDALEEAMIYANQMIYNHAVGNDYLLGMGTTIVLVLIRNDKVYYGHVGDSRLYLFKNNIFDQMTVDHSKVQQLINEGKISKKEAVDHPQRNEITRALGLTSKFEPEVSPRAIIPQDGDILLLCTDGLTNMVDNDEIVSILDTLSSLNDKASKLISKANKNGGLDNISIQLVRFHNLGQEMDAEDDNLKPFFETLRSLLKKRYFIYFLISLFVLGTSFFVGLYESPEVIISSERKTYNEGSNEVIIAYLLKEGDDIEKLANRFNTTEDLLKRLNPNYENVITGMHIKIPVRYLHTVQQVDELPLIVVQYDSDIFDIMKANSLCNNSLKIGSELIIPLKSKK